MADSAARKESRELGPFFALSEETPLLSLLATRGARFSGTVLDVGTGTGRMLRAVTRMATPAMMIGADVSEAMLQAAVKATGGMGSVRYLAGDSNRLPICDESVDVAIACGTFEAMNDLAPSLREMWRVLRPGGHLGFTCWNRARRCRFPLWDISKSCSDFDAESLAKEVASAGFRDLVVRSSFFLPPGIFHLVWAGTPTFFRHRVSRFFGARNLRCFGQSPTQMDGWELIVCAGKRTDEYIR